MTWKNVLIILAIIILIVLGGVFFRNKANAPTNAPAQTNSSSNNQTKSNMLEGVLRKSDQATKGNLMLEIANSNRVVYLRTSRDFTQLIGQDVTVIIDGTTDSFVIMNILPKDSIQGNTKVN